MPRGIKRNFTGGEVADTISSRDDLAKYQSSCRVMTNFIAQLHGGARFRPGTGYIGTSLGYGIMIPFEFNTEEEDIYVLDFTPGKIRIIQGEGYVLSGGVPVEIATPLASVTLLYKLTFAQVGDVVFFAHEDYGEFTLTRNSHTSWTWATAAFGTLQAKPTGGIAIWNGQTLAAGSQAAPTAPTATWDGQAGGTTAAYYKITAVNANGIESLPTAAFFTSDAVAQVDWLSTDEVELAWTAPSGAYKYKVYKRNAVSQYGYIGETISTQFVERGYIQPDATKPPPSSTTPDFVQYYKVAAVNANGVESVGSTAFSVGALPSAEWIAGDVITLTWAAVAGAVEYNIYKSAGGSYGFIGTSTVLNFRDDNITPDPTLTPQVANNPFATSKASAICFHQQRMWLAVLNKVYASRTGDYLNFNKSRPVRDDDALEFTLFSAKINQVKWLTDFGDLLAGTAGAEMLLKGGGSSEAITPINVNGKAQSYWGSRKIPPIAIGNSLLHVTRQGDSIRDLFYSLEKDGYLGNDLAVLANQLFDGYTIVSWAYQQKPDSVVWAVRSDGALLGMTYLKEHEVWGWHKHTTEGGYYENVCVVAGGAEAGAEDKVYFKVRRSVNGATVRYVEKLKDKWRAADGIENAFFVDSGLTYNGWNADPGEMIRIEGGSTWAAGETVQLFAQYPFAPFTTASVGKRYRLRVGADTVNALITGYVSLSKVHAVCYTDVPVSMRTVYTAEWAALASVVSGLDHLEGKSVVALADGSPLASAVVASGEINLGGTHAAIVNVGLPYTGVLAPLPFELVSEAGNTTQGHPRGFGEIRIRLFESVGGKIGASGDNDVDVDSLPMNTLSYTPTEWGAAVPPFTGVKAEVGLGGVDDNLTIYVVQDAPLPLTVLSIIADVDYGDNSGREG